MKTVNLTIGVLYEDKKRVHSQRGFSSYRNDAAETTAQQQSVGVKECDLRGTEGRF